METYKIVRNYAPNYSAGGQLLRRRRPRTIKTGLTLEEAQAHCGREDTHGNEWFDGYTKEA